MGREDTSSKMAAITMDNGIIIESVEEDNFIFRTIN